MPVEPWWRAACGTVDPKIAVAGEDKGGRLTLRVGARPVVVIRLLGGVRATDGETPIDIGPAKCQTVLAVLVLAAGSAVTVPRLVDLVWGEQPPRTAEKTLQSYVVRLRKGLGAGSIARVGAAYRLTVDPEAIDVARFRQHLAAGNIEAALAEWTGTPIAGLAGHGLTPAVDRLVEEWLAAVEIDLERRLQVNPAAAIGPLTELTASHPFREGLWSLLMTALYRVGRQADALEAFQRARHHLVEQLGVEPGPRLRELEALVLGQDEQLRGLERSTDQPSARPTGTVTFGFCEVEDSARLWATHRKKMAATVARLDAVVRAVVNRHRGYVFATGGETFGAAFHRADDAVAWARELQLEVTREPWPGGLELRLRLGMHTGETEEGATSYFGPVVNAAAHLAAAGHGGQTLVSGVTAALLDRDDVRDLGTYRLEGELSAMRSCSWTRGSIRRCAPTTAAGTTFRSDSIDLSAGRRSSRPSSRPSLTLRWSPWWGPEVWARPGSPWRQAWPTPSVPEGSG